MENPIQELYDDKQYGISFLVRLGEYLGLEMSRCELCEMETPTFIVGSHYDVATVCMVCESGKETFK